MSEETVQVSKSLLETLLGFLKPKQDEPPVETPPDGVKPEEFKAITSERDNYKAQLDTLKAESQAKELRSNLTAQLQSKEKFGMVYVELKSAEEASAVLATMSPEQREWCMRNFAAFIAQIDESKLLGETGSESAETIGANPVAEFDAQVKKIAAEKSIDYNSALTVAKTTHADLFKAAYGGK